MCTVLAPLPGRCANFFSVRFRFAHRDGCSPVLMSKLLVKFGCRLHCLFILMSKLFHYCMQTLHGINFFFIGLQRQQAPAMRLSAWQGTTPPHPTPAPCRLRWPFSASTRQPAARRRDQSSHRTCPQNKRSECCDCSWSGLKFRPALSLASTER